MTTVTEALAEIKTIGKRIGKKTEFIKQYVIRQEQVKDPLEKDGGSVKALKAESQGIADLQKRIIVIRSAIMRSNLATQLTIGPVTMSVADWLTWRKDVAPLEVKRIAELRQGIESTRQQFRAKGVTVGAAGADLKPTDLVVSVDEAALAAQAEELENVLGVLDGKLSLLNATTTLDI